MYKQCRRGYWGYGKDENNAKREIRMFLFYLYYIGGFHIEWYLNPFRIMGIILFSSRNRYFFGGGVSS